MKKLYTIFALAGLIAISDMNAMSRFYGASRQAFPYARQVGRSLFLPQNITLPRRSFSWQTMHNLGQKFPTWQTMHSLRQKLPTWQTMHSLRQKLPTWQTMHSLRQKLPTFKSSPFVRTYTPMVLGVGGTVGTVGAAATLAKEKERKRMVKAKEEKEKKWEEWRIRQEESYDEKRRGIEEAITESTDKIYYAERKLEQLKEWHATAKNKYKSLYVTPWFTWHSPEEKEKMEQEIGELDREIIIQEEKLKDLNWGLEYALDYWKQYRPLEEEERKRSEDFWKRIHFSELGK